MLQNCVNDSNLNEGQVKDKSNCRMPGHRGQMTVERTFIGK